jgi:hypothetical protein
MISARTLVFTGGNIPSGCAKLPGGIEFGSQVFSL